MLQQEDYMAEGNEKEAAVLVPMNHLQHTFFM